ncbi:AlbA family DNA-binding domain-containing protein [Clostridium sp. C105KSO13]|uniref:AlbA family DNA-binding domain-containing protein n=1 Tax=Clostridium sp. C105KSO13 TaxID=1776045 RepID=UPI000A5DEF05|nr:ATP-binding protein [Clostridium sp. C105KSO13]
MCSFLNRYGGDIYLGTADDGNVVGIPERAAADMVRNFIKVISNPNTFQPTVYLEAKIVKYKDKTIIHLHVPPSSEV